MKAGKLTIGRLMGGAAALAVFAPALASAQQGSPTPTPRATPAIITLPGASQFDLRPSGSQPVTRPTPTPTTRPMPAQTTAGTPTVRATPTPRPAAAGRPRATPTAPAAASTPQPVPTPEATPLTQPVATASPTPATALTATPTPVPAAVSSGVPWFWILVGAAMAGVLVALGWLLGRRRQPPRPVEKPAAAAAPKPPAPPRPVPPPPAVAPPAPPRPAPRPTRPADPIVVELRPIAIELSDNGAILDFELTLGNTTAVTAEGMRVAYGLMSASQIQDELIAGFHNTQLPSVADPFDLAPRAGIRVPGRLALAPDKINIVDVGGRPMFVPLLVVDLRWRSGLSLKHQGYDFMVGLGGASDKLGPVWLDKGAQRLERLNATRYFPKPVVAAAE